MLICKTVGVFEEEFLHEFFGIPVCQEMLGKTVKIRKIGDIEGQLSTVHITTEGEVIFSSEGEKMFYVT